ncbi:glycoside hydrolase family 16 protein, partial [Aspergillus homomorphus CBS 101889]
CDCYLISGPEPGYFTHYKLWDFRNTAHIPRQPQPAPPLGQTNDDLDTEILEATTNLFSQTPFSKDWHVQTWHRAADPLLSPIPMTNSESNVFLMKAPRSSPPGQNASQANTFLTFRTTRFSNHATTAEIESRLGLIDHCSLRLRMRLMSRETALYRPYTDISDPNPSIKPQPQRVPSGTCAGIFTYRSATCESDIEILTADWPYTIHYANQPDYDPITDKIIPNASAVVNLTRPWTEWTTHRLDWQPRSTRWYADGALQAVKTYRVPDRPSLIVLNLWTNGGSWTGDLRVGESVYLGIEWMELVYNLSSS